MVCKMWVVMHQLVILASVNWKQVITSTVCRTLMVSLLFYLSTVFGSVQMLKLYGVPYMILLCGWTPLLASPWL
ncbi:hypothetical protein ACSBR1_031279 [Camellia fascicularis]